MEEKDSLGNYYDAELLQVDEKSNMQILMYGSLAKEEADVLPGHIWVERSFLEVQNMKYYCPTVLQACLKEQQPMKWVNRVIMWCADKMPSFGDAFLPESPKSA